MSDRKEAPRGTLVDTIKPRARDGTKIARDFKRHGKMEKTCDCAKWEVHVHQLNYV